MTLVRHALEKDLPAVEALRRADGSSLGFVPLAKYQHIVNRTSDRGRLRWRYEWLLVATDNEDLTGFCLAGFHRDGAKIEQVCVREDARRMERALMLVDAIEEEARRRGSRRLRCRVAYDIEANFFWRAIGYTPISTVTSTWLNLRESSSRRPLIVYDKILDQLVIDGLDGIVSVNGNAALGGLSNVAGDLKGLVFVRGLDGDDSGDLVGRHSHLPPDDLMHSPSGQPCGTGDVAHGVAALVGAEDGGVTLSLGLQDAVRPGRDTAKLRMLRFSQGPQPRPPESPTSPGLLPNRLSRSGSNQGATTLRLRLAHTNPRPTQSLSCRSNRRVETHQSWVVL